MNTARVDICYRPLKIAWAIPSGDFASFRKAVRYSHALWGGRFNPIIIADRQQEATRLIELFRADIIVPIGDQRLVVEFPAQYPHLINPFFHEGVFVKGDQHSSPRSQALDVINALVYLRENGELRELKEKGVRLFGWSVEDPLADVLLSQLGAYPDPAEIGTDYRAHVLEECDGQEVALDMDAALPAELLIEHPGIAYLQRHRLRRYFGMRGGWQTPGFFVGSAASFDDLVCCWNLRACDIPLWFVDLDHRARYTSLIPAWESAMRDRVAVYRNEWDRRIGIWTRREDVDAVAGAFAAKDITRMPVSEHTWNGLNVRAPMMILGDASALGVASVEQNRPRVSFSLPDKPFCSNMWFHQQHLVASVALLGAGHLDHEQSTFRVPYIPELNEFYAREMHFQYDRVRVEPERVGIVIDAGEHDSFLYALPVSALMERMFALAGYEAKLSTSGLMTRQLIAQLGGLQGARVFKIPGVRRLIRTHGPTAAFRKSPALQLIASRDPERAGSQFSDHESLHIEPRPNGEKLTPDAVFGYLVEKRLFRVGGLLTCPNCRMASWTALDALRQELTCELCGQVFDSSRQLANQNELHYRRSGVFGAERNVQGAVPVALTLQQLDTNLRSGLGYSLYSPSLDLVPAAGSAGLTCEIDLVWLVLSRDEHKTAVLLGECKDEGPITLEDIETLRQVAESLPSHRFDVYVVLAQLAPFSSEQIRAARTLNTRYRRRVILLTARELEPYFMYERAKKELGVELRGSGPESMAEATERMYFASEERGSNQDA